MTENDVIVIVNAMQDHYEEKTGKPRHDQNLRNFGKVFDFISKAKGVFLAVTFVLGLPAFVASCIVISKALQGK